MSGELKTANKAKYLTALVALFIIVVFIGLLFTTNVWIVLSVGFLYMAVITLSHRLNQVVQRIEAEEVLISGAINLLSEATKIQSERVTDIQRFLSRLVQPKPDLTIH